MAKQTGKQRPLNKKTKALTLKAWRNAYESHIPEYLEAVKAVIEAADKMKEAEKKSYEAMAESGKARKEFQDALENLKQIADYKS